VEVGFHSICLSSGWIWDFNFVLLEVFFLSWGCITFDVGSVVIAFAFFFFVLGAILGTVICLELIWFVFFRVEAWVEIW